MSISTYAEPNQISTSRLRSIVALLVGFSFMTWFNRLSMAVAYDTKIGREHGISEATIGMVYSAFLLSYLVFMTPGGWFIDRFGAKLAILIVGLGAGLFAALTSLAGLASIQEAGLLVAILLIVRFAMGFFSAPYYPAAARVISIWVPTNWRAFALGLNQAAANVGMACAFPLFGAMVDMWDWPAAFVASGIVTMFLGLLWWLIAPAQTSPVPSVSPAAQNTNSVFALLRNRNVMLLTVIYATMGYLAYLFFFWMNHYFSEVLHVDSTASRNYAAILFLSMAVGMASGGFLADRFRKRFGGWFGQAAVPMAGMILSAVFLGLGLVSVEIDWIVFWLALALLAVGLAESPTWMAVVEFGGPYGATAAAILNTGGNLGGFITPMLTPVVAMTVRDSFGLSELAGWQWGIALAGVFCLLGAMLWLWVRGES